MGRTKAEKRAEMAMEAIRPLHPSEVRRAEQLYASIRACKGSAWCSACGHVMEGSEWIEKEGKAVRCPHCGARLKVVKSRQTVDNEKYYYQHVGVINGLQYIRTFLVERKARKGCESSYWMGECVRVFIDGEGRKVYFARTRYSGMFCDLWNFNSELGLKRVERYCYRLGGETNKNPILIPEVRRNGLLKLDKGFKALTQIEEILTNPKAETLLKAGWTELWQGCVSGEYDHFVMRHWATIRIALRRGWRPSSLKVWSDLLGMLEGNGKDLRNPVFVCPDNLQEAHDRELEESERRIERERAEARKREKQERLETLARLMEGGKADKDYVEGRSPWLGWRLEKEGVTLVVLGSIKEFFEEGEEMHHCVFSASYYDLKKHPFSLILGARVDGKRTETVEVSVDNWKVVQCMGKYNKPSAYHDTILGLVKGSMAELRKLAPNRAV